MNSTAEAVEFCYIWCMDDSFFKQYGITPYKYTGYGKVSERTVFVYRNVEIAMMEVYEDTDPERKEYSFISKLGIKKRICKFERVATTPKADAKLAELVNAYVVPVYKKPLSKWCNRCPGYYWDIDEYGDTELENMFLKVMKYVDTELETDPSRVNGWNLRCRLVRWHLGEISRLTDYQCMVRFPYKDIVFLREFELENGHRAIATIASRPDRHHHTLVIKTFDPASRSNESRHFFIVNTYCGRLCGKIVEITSLEVEAINRLLE